MRSLFIPLAILFWAMAVKYNTHMSRRGRLVVGLLFTAGHFAYTMFDAHPHVVAAGLSALCCGAVACGGLAYLRNCRSILWWVLVLAATTLGVFVAPLQLYMVLEHSWASAAPLPHTGP